MSWQGPSAPRVEGMAPKSLVVASCASKPVSTASTILFWMSLAVIFVLVSCCRRDQIILSARAQAVAARLSESRLRPYIAPRAYDRGNHDDFTRRLRLHSAV